MLTNSSTGCIIPDECILVTSPGKSWCRYLGDAKMWPIGYPSAAVDVEDRQGSPPKGCACFNAVEHDILLDGAPAIAYANLLEEIEFAARNQCDFLVPSGYDNNCYDDGKNGSVAETPFSNGPGACVGDCIYTDDCGDPNPYECECLVGQCGGSGETGGSGDNGSNGGGVDGLSSGSYISCLQNDCDIDSAFAEMLWDEPTLLLSESTRLVYDAATARFMFYSVGSGSVADELGFQSGDVLESVGSVVIDDLDTALGVFASSRDAMSIDVRVLRGTQWVDFTFTFVN